MKKNAIYDLLTNQLEFVNPRDIVQYYNVNRLHHDISRTLECGVHLLNMATEPVNVGVVAREVFGITLDDSLANRRAHFNYDVKTKFARLWSKPGDYLYSREEILRDLKDFARSEE